MSLILLPLLAGAALAAPLKPSALTEELGLVQAQGRWEYRRRGCQGHPTQVRSVPHPEAPGELAELEAFAAAVETLTPEARHRAYYEILAKAVQKEGIPPDQFLWFEKAGDGLKVGRECGLTAVAGCVMGDCFASRFQKPEDPLAGLPRSLGGSRDIEAEIELPPLERISFDGGGKAPSLTLEPAPAPRDPIGAEKDGPTLDLDFAWGSSPRADANSRNLNTIYGLWALGKDESRGFILGKRDDSWVGAVVRGAEAPLDFGLAWLSTLFRHERGHIEYAALGGARARWVDENNSSSAFGHVVRIEDDWEKMTAAERKAFISGGVNVTQAGLAWRREKMFSSDSLHWSHAPQWIMDKLDFINYMADAPRPSRREEEHDANDMVNYAAMHGAGSGRDPDEVHRDMMRAAVWTALDPTNFLMVKNYGWDYMVNGRRATENPMPEAFGRQWWLGTGAHLSEVGVMYALDILSRDPESGTLLTFSPKLGEGRQWGFGAKASSFEVWNGLRGRAGLEVWGQRDSAAPGPKRVGGAAFLGAEIPLGKNGGFSADLGFKTEGEMLGQPHDEGPFWTVGGHLRF